MLQIAALSAADKRQLAKYCSDLLREIAHERRERLRLQARLDLAVSRAKDRYGSEIEEHKQKEQDIIRILLRTLLPDFLAMAMPGTKTVRLRGGEVSLRTNPVSIEVVDEDQAFAYLKRRGMFRRFTRVKYELDKAALKKAPQLLRLLPGIKVVQRQSVVLRLPKVQGEIIVDGDTLSLPLPD